MGTKVWGSQTPGSSSLSFWVNGGNTSMKADSPSVTTNEEGYIDAVYVYARTQNGSAATAKVGIYGTGGSLMEETPLFTLSGSIGWQGQIFGSNGYLHVAANSGIVAGIWTNTNGLEIYAVGNGGVFEYNQSAGDLPNPWSGTQKTSWGGLAWYCTYFPRATVSSIPSTPVAPGQQFVIGGQSFSCGVNSITVNGVNVPTFTVNSDTQVTATLPVGATTGKVTVNTKAGSGTSAASLIVSSAHIFRSGVATNAQGIFLFRSGQPSQSQGVLRYHNGQWVNAQ